MKRIRNKSLFGVIINLRTPRHRHTRVQFIITIYKDTNV